MPESPMPVADKQPPTGIQVKHEVERCLAERIPSGWSFQARRTEALTGRCRADLLAEIASPAGETAVLVVEIKRTLEPRDISHAVEQLSTITAGASGTLDAVSRVGTRPSRSESGRIGPDPAEQADPFESAIPIGPPTWEI